MKKDSVSVSELLEYLTELENNPEEKERFNRSIKKAAQKERKRKDGEFSAMFLDAIRIP